MVVESYRVAEIGALVGDPARANILTELMAGRALTAGELAAVARITPQTAIVHLRKLAEAKLVRSEKQGRHHYVRLASPEVARMLESMLSVVAAERISHAKPPRVKPALKRARTCYDHLAGELGVVLCDVLVAREHVVVHAEAAELTPSGLAFSEHFGVKLDDDAKTRRPLCRTCIDWSERRPHLAGRFGAALATRLFERKWVERVAQGRALAVTRAGANGLRDVFAIAW
jgi:DNA-binding transcriptional ArsR family regulator